MSYIQKPTAFHPALKKNKLGLTRRDYEGAMSTLCAGCGHDSITAAIIEACFKLDLPAHRLAKVSGIGCSSKAPTYFLSRSHGFNSVHGRMPSITTGANLANRDLIYLGVSGDGDTASIGLSQFCHAMRRQLNMTYIVMNNGCYGLTKGQFSATNDKTSPSKKGESNLFEAIDLAQIAIQLGAGFVGRSFSGDKAQLVPMIEAAMSYNGFAFLDVISPCVTFNNHPGSTKSYDYVRGHNSVLDKLDFVPAEEEIEIDYAEGTTSEVDLHGGAKIHLHKLDTGYDPTNADQAINTIRTRLNKGEVTTGLLYFDGREQDLHETLGTSERALNQIPISELCPGSKNLAPINDRFR
ncbi:MAG: 2-oxoacid:ferredoxin oxidoreductase subunit beta [Alphaproteobacteria bacterium]|nr:2-oxoacid:ferredoxin oxidoreductase subunit beta [Alphaproteobacteria bacterium]